MKKAAAFILTALLLINSVFAVSTDLSDRYNQKESVLVKISGNILQPINKDQVEFRRGHVALPLDYDIKKIGDYNYIWFNTPESEDNYTLVLKNVVTTASGVVKEAEFQQNFSVGENKSDYTIWPGIIYTREDFSIRVFLNIDETQTIKVSYPTERDVTLKPGDNFIKFNVRDFINQNVTDFSIGDYEVVAYIYGNGSTIINYNPGAENLRFKPRIIQSVALINDIGTNYPFEIINGGYTDYNLELDYNKDLFDVYPIENNFTVKSGELLMFNLSLKKYLPEGINEVITARNGNLSWDMLVAINFTDNASNIATPYLNESLNDTYGMRCIELGGRICAASEVCTNTTTSTFEGECCLALCTQKENNSDYSWVGYVLGGVGVLVLVYVFIKYKKTKPGANSIKEKFAIAEKGKP